MKYFLTLLLLISLPACAEWKFIGENSNDKFFIDPETIRKDGKITSVWTLVDYESIDDGSLSVRAKKHYDCRKELTRISSLDFFAENMAQGKVIKTYSYQEIEWQDVPPQSLDSKIFKILCSSKASSLNK